ncbi:Fibronectin type III domain-containing protein 3B [Hondaea fermentalgiana]|uniref:Fibronectin type III domain-containing protein 3B n=1 Tax=Hondaea fermentalgiana TaxID=2315210 RepID=A0A2R5GFJ4_9STRA|nr:Fibronectin type III domain-containing protein 3B [Hondaea fermentalgiana]|eukprot:GBG27403.1 Fibronectin type III domain-containing protein 3B [Hondaea fermentalgiana]
MLVNLFERILQAAADANGLGSHRQTLEVLEAQLLQFDDDALRRHGGTGAGARSTKMRDDNIDDDELDTVVRSQSLFERLGKVCGARFELTDDEINTVQELFGSGHGYLRHHDFVAGLRAFYQTQAGERFAQRVRELLEHAADQHVEVRLYFRRFDPEACGSISREDFGLALQSLGLNAQPEEISFLASSYVDGQDAAKVAYALFLQDMLENGDATKAKTAPSQKHTEHIKQFSATSIDVLVRLREFARDYISLNPDGYKELWFQMESNDERLRGWITPDQLAQGFAKVGYSLAPIDLRRLQARFALQDDMQECIRYRDLLMEILAPTRQAEVTPRQQQRQHQHQQQGSSPQDETQSESPVLDSSRRRAGLHALEYLTQSELKSFLLKLHGLTGTGPFVHIDVRDVFEQFDKYLTGRIRFSDFMQCMEWLGFIRGAMNADGECESNSTNDHGAGGTVHERSLVRRLANHLQGSNQDDVDYRKLFVLLEDFRHSPAMKATKRVPPHERELEKLIAALKDKARILRLSNVTLTDCFAAFDTTGSEKLTHRDFHSALLQLGIHVAIVALPRALSAFEASGPSAGQQTSEVGVYYKKVADLVYERLAEEDFDPGVAFWDDGMDEANRSPASPSSAAAPHDPVLDPELNTRRRSEHLRDRFEFVKLLRQYIADSAGERPNPVQFLHTLRSCFDDLDVAQDGAIQLHDLIEASELLGLPLSRTEAARVADFPFLFYRRALKPGGKPQLTGPRSPEELVQDANQPARVRELTFDAFCLLVDPMYSHRRDQVSAQTDSLAVHSEAWTRLFAVKEETHYSREEIVGVLRDVVRSHEDLHGPCGLLEALEARDSTFSDRVEIEEFRAVLAESLQLKATSTEIRRLSRRLGILEKNSSKESASCGPQAQAAEDLGDRALVVYRELVSEIAPEEFIVMFTSHDENALEQLRCASFQGKPLMQKLAQLELNDSVSRAAVSRVLMTALDGVQNLQQLDEAAKEIGGNQERDEERIMQTEANARSVLRILRKFTQPQTNMVDLGALTRVLHLDIPVSKERKLRQILDDGGSEEFRSLLERFEKEDRQFLGYLPVQIFQRCTTDFFEHLHIDDVESSRICQRFETCDARRQICVDYRAMLRYFSTAPPGSYTGDQEGDANSKNSRQLQLEDLIRLSKRSNGVWKYIWGRPSAESGSGKQRKVNEMKGRFAKHDRKAKTKTDSQLSFAQWKILKDLLQNATRIMESVSGDLASEDDHWLRAGRALAATDLLISVRCGGPVGESLEQSFLAWSKRGRAFEDGLVFTAEAKSGDEANQKFIRLCRERWTACEREVRKELVVARFEHLKLQEIQATQAEDSEDDLPEKVHSNEGQSSRTASGKNKFSVRRFLQRIGPDDLQAWTKEIEATAERKRVQTEKETAKEREATHAHFVRRKHQLRLRLPQNATQGSSSLMKTQQSLDPVLKGLLERSHHRYVHATSFMDLEKCRKLLLQAGYVFAENFVDPDGYVDDRVLEGLQDYKRKTQMATTSARRQGADHQFTLWLERKRARAQAERFLEAIDQPAIAVGTIGDRESLWRDVGKALKAVDAKGLLSNFIQWSSGFAGRAKCAAAWSQFPPKTFATTSSKDWEWVHLRSVLVKLLSNPDVDLVTAFQRVVGPAGDRSASSAFYQKTLCACPTDRFREILASAGIQLRLHEEKRLTSCFCGRDADGEVIPDTVNMNFVLQIASRQAGLGNASPQASQASWTRPKAGILSHGREYELSLEERVQQALVVAGAPSDIAMHWREQRAELQRALVFLSVVSRQNRLAKAQHVHEQKHAVPPGTPALFRVPELSSATSITLGYKISGRGNPNVSFYCVERVHKGSFTVLWQDPPSLTQPPSLPEGRFVVGDLEPNTEYFFRVTAFNEHGASRPSRKSFWTAPLTPHKPRASNCTYEGRLARCVMTWSSGLDLPSAAGLPVAAISSNLDKRSGPTDKDEGDFLPATITGSYYELLVRDMRLAGLQAHNVGVVIYRGKQTSCQVVGLEPGSSYEFVVRALNRHEDASKMSHPCIVLPLSPPRPPIVSVPAVTWKPYNCKPDAVAVERNGAVGNVADTFRRWEATAASIAGGETLGLKSVATRTSFVVQIRSAKGRSESFETKGHAWTLPKLRPNATYTVRLRVRCQLMLDQPISFQSPWSTNASFQTAPNVPSRPVLVEAFADSLLLRWYAPKGGAHQYVVQYRTLPGEASTDTWTSSKPKEPWIPAYRGRSTLTRVYGLKPSSMVEVRVIATDAENQISSEPSDVIVASTLTAAQSQLQLTRPSSAKTDFSIPCVNQDLIPGDLVLFSERQGLPCWRTIAGRIVAEKEGKFWLEVQWSTVDNNTLGSSVEIPSGACIQRTKEEVFRHEPELGIYRKAWVNEESRQGKSKKKGKTKASKNSPSTIPDETPSTIPNETNAQHSVHSPKNATIAADS